MSSSAGPVVVPAPPDVPAVADLDVRLRGGRWQVTHHDVPLPLGPYPTRLAAEHAAGHWRQQQADAFRAWCVAYDHVLLTGRHGVDYLWDDGASPLAP